MNNIIKPCLWFDNQAKEAAKFYCSIFNDCSIVSENDFIVEFILDGFTLLGMNGGPLYKINPSISLFVTCKSDSEIEDIYNKLFSGGSAMMPLDKYPWAEKYGWVVDKFGMTWQLILDKSAEQKSKIIPALLFVNEMFGKAQDAINYYKTIFPNSKELISELYTIEDAQPDGFLKFGMFELNNSLFVAMDGPGNNNFAFNEAVSFVITCDNQNEIDYFWDKLTLEGQENRCGWLKDRFGISWQIVPSILSQLMSDKSKRGKVTESFLKMVKFDIQELLTAANNDN